MAYYVFTNAEKERMAKEAIATKGRPSGYRGDPRSGEVQLAQCTLYFRALDENPKISEEDLLMYIYKGLGGRVEEYATEPEATLRVENLKGLKKKASRM